MVDITLVKWATANNGDNYIKKEVRITSEELELLKNLLQDDLVVSDYLKYRPKFKTYKIPENWQLIVEDILKKLEAI